MAYKPEIQYVGQFYVHGSEAKQVAPKRRPQFQLPKPKPEKIEKIYVDPVAFVGIVVAVVMLVAMVIGACQIHSSWQEYEEMSHNLSIGRTPGLATTTTRVSILRMWPPRLKPWAWCLWRKFLRCRFMSPFRFRSRKRRHGMNLCGLFRDCLHKRQPCP